MLGELPGVTLLTGPIAPRLVDGKIVLGTGKMDRLDEPVRLVLFPLQGYLAGGFPFPLMLDFTARRLESLLEEPALLRSVRILIRGHDRDKIP
ncbi:hypothetical protein ES703_124835 [subsurface metagenome]